jgi:propionyl-CoA synthetase
MDKPDASSFFAILGQHNVVSSFWSPTALRIIRPNDPGHVHSRKYPLDHFRALFVAGDDCVCDKLVWRRTRKIFSQKPTFDHYWQTETGTGTPVTAVCLGLDEQTVRLE